MKRILFSILLLICVTVTWAQVAQYDTVRVGDQWGLLARNPRYKDMDVKMVVDVKQDTTSTWWRRLMVQTNVVDWMVTVPNLTIGYDLGDPFVRTTPTLLIGMRNTFGGYRWYNQENSYDYQAVKVELRRHWVPRKYRRNIVADEPPQANGRFYAGIYGEYSWDNHLDGWNFHKSDKFENQDMWVPYGPSYIAGMTWGYELRKRNYNHRVHFNWDFGIDVGCVYVPKMERNFYPIVSDIRVALNFRHDRMNFLYWKPSEKQFNRNTNYNNDLKLRLAKCRELIDSIGGATLYVTSASGDSTFVEIINRDDVVKEVQKQLGFKNLKQGDVANYETSTKFPLQGKQLGEYYSLDYRFGMRPENKLEEQYGTDTVAFSFPFRVRMKGYEAADSLLLAFEHNVTKWRDEHGGNYPSLKMKHLDRERVEGHATIEQIIALFKEVGGIELKPEQITGVFYKSDELKEVPIEEVYWRVKRNCYYSVGIRLHPQVELLGGAMASRFVIDFDDAELLQSEYSALARYFNSGRRISIDRVWTGGDVEPVSATEIVDAIARDTNDSIDFLRPSMIELADSANTIGQHRFTLTFDAMFAKIADRKFYIADTLGRNNAERIHKVINDLGYVSYYRDFGYVGYPTLKVEDPGDASLITPEMVAEAMSKFYGVQIEPYMVAQPVYSDQYNKAVYTQAWPEHPEAFRGLALIRLHPEYPNNIKFYYKVIKK